MEKTSLGVTTRPLDPALVAGLVARYERVGLDGLLAGRGARARWVRPPAGAAVSAFAWGWREAWSQRWWPQGIDIRTEELAGGETRRILAVSWFAQLRRGRGQGARITFVELRRGRRAPRYHHVLLVSPEVEADGQTRMRPVPVHAGGIAWDGDRILVAATFGGLRSFDVRDILRVPRSGGFGSRHPDVPFGFRHVLPQSVDHRLTRGSAADRARFSFVSVDRSVPDGDELHIVGGEYTGDRTDGRLFRFGFGADSGGDLRTDSTREIGEVLVPGIPRMQGACVVDDRWFVASSDVTRPGDLWTGRPESMVRHRRVLPAGPEDLAYDPVDRRVWGLCEYPFHRRVFTIDPDPWRAPE